MKPQDVTLFFVLQRGPLSLRGRLLALSIRKFLDPNIKVRAAIPYDFPKPNHDTLALMDHLEIETKYFAPEIAKAYDYNIGNKLDASLMGFDTEYAMFLDTDTLFLQSAEWEKVFAENPGTAAQHIMGRGAYVGKTGLRFRQYAQDEFDIEAVPPSDDPMARPRDVCGFPVYNSGAVLYRTDNGFAQDWYQVTKQILEADLPQELKRPYADQSSLAIVLASGKYNPQFLPKGWNAHPSRPNQAVLVHYFSIIAALRYKHICKVLIDLWETGREQGFDPMEEWAGRDIKYFKNIWE